MAEATLYFRHLPTELSKEERKDFLFSFGASRVHVMGTSGRLKNTAFASFPSKDHATEVLHQLHQADLLGSKLIVEIARHNDSHTPSLVDGDKKKSADMQENKTLDGRDDPGKTKMEPKEIKFDGTFNAWGLKHPRRPELRYRYPPPNPSILTNIMNALVAMPKFYIQVLHLMNKMDLPAPFGTVTPAPPLVSGPVTHDDVNQKEMEISSSEEETESEMESDGENNTHNRIHNAKEFVENASRHRHKTLKKWVRAKRPRLSEFHPADNVLLPDMDKTNVPIQDVFDQMPDSSTDSVVPMGKKLALNFKLSAMESSDGKKPSDSHNVNQHMQRHQQPPMQIMSSLQPLPPVPTCTTSTNLSLTSSTVSNERSTSRVPPYHQHLHQPPPHFSTSSASPSTFPPHHPFRDISQDWTAGHQPSGGAKEKDNDSKGEDSVNKLRETSDGFGTIPSNAKVLEDSNVQRKEDDPPLSSSKGGSNKRNSKFISSSELRRGRLTKDEMQESSVFRRYDAGEASCRLYIKNVARQATEEDLRHIYGRYVDWESETEVNMFDIRLMKEGRMKGQAFITLPSQDVAMDALKDTHGFLLKDKPLVVQFARSAKAQEDAAAVKS